MAWSNFDLDDYHFGMMLIINEILIYTNDDDP
jgi:hypothetical protein